MKKILRWSETLKNTYGERVQKVSIDIGASCPHRENLNSGGCVFCDSKGGGSGAWLDGISVKEQVEKGIDGAQNHYKARKIILYFQSYSTTNVPLNVLKHHLHQAANAAKSKGAQTVAVAFGTRPDLIPNETIDFLLQIASQNLEVWLEMGIQTIDETGLKWLRRGHNMDCVKDSLTRLQKHPSINLCAHLISGIPGEDPNQLAKSATWLADQGVKALKFHPLHVLRGTPLENLYLQKKFTPLEKEDYIDRAIKALKNLPEGIIMQRLVAGVRPPSLIAPLWLCDKSKIENEIETRFASEIAEIETVGISQ